MSFSGALTSRFLRFSKEPERLGCDRPSESLVGMRRLLHLPVGSRGCLLPPFLTPSSFLHSGGLCTVWTPQPTCLSPIHTPAVGNPDHPIGPVCLGIQLEEPCVGDRSLREAMLRGEICVGPGSGYRAISKVQEASREGPASIPTGCFCPRLMTTWTWH